MAPNGQSVLQKKRNIKIHAKIVINSIVIFNPKRKPVVVRSSGCVAVIGMPPDRVPAGQIY